MVCTKLNATNSPITSHDSQGSFIGTELSTEGLGDKSKERKSVPKVKFTNSVSRTLIYSFYESVLPISKTVQRKDGYLL